MTGACALSLPPSPVEPRIVGWRAICAVLAECDWPMTRFAALRLSLRRVRPLPVDGPGGRPFSRRTWLEGWVAEERRRHNRSPWGPEQLALDLGTALDDSDRAREHHGKP